MRRPIPGAPPARKPRGEATGFQETGRIEGLPLPSKPWMPAPFDKADVAAMKALAAGAATHDQQRRALTWILEYAGRGRVNPYIPGGQDAMRDSDFGAGCRHVAEQIIKLMNWRVTTNEEQGR